VCRYLLSDRRLSEPLTGPGPAAAANPALIARLARLPAALALAGAFGWPGAAFAHSLSNRFGDFYGGMLHPVTALEHALPIFALGLLAGQQGARAARWVLLVFPLALLLGATLATVAPALSWVSLLNKASFALLGALVAGAWRLPLPAVGGLAALFGLSHGYENGMAMTPDVAAHLFVPGVALIGFLLAALVSAATLALSARAEWLCIAVRVAGSWIAAIGILMLGVA
jgi:urease accessory protein